MTVVDVWLVPVMAGAGDDPALALSADDRRLVSSLGFPADRDRAATARAAARHELGRRLGLEPALVPLVARGRPVVEGTDLELSWSHSGDWVALAIAESRPVGVDIEQVPPRVPTKALAGIGVSSLADFVAREAAGKATGQGLSGPWPPDVTVVPFPAPAGYLAAVATPGSDWTLRLHPAPAMATPARRR